jgi:hypothetical protein
MSKFKVGDFVFKKIDPSVKGAIYEVETSPSINPDKHYLSYSLLRFENKSFIIESVSVDEIDLVKFAHSDLPDTEPPK